MRTLIVSLCISFCALTSMAQKTQAYLDYIDKYGDWAVEQMQQYRIPASITLAQGLLESRAGQSRLAVRANNHFGIKVGANWTGPYVLENDDAPNERFRKYASVRESYEDHSLFLTRSKRYSSLFTLKATDYRGWAYGLKQCGYATSSTYAQSLIRLIELYELNRYDTGVKPAKANVEKKEQKTSVTKNEHGVFVMNGNYYVIAEEGDTFKGLARETGVSEARLRKYNELPKDYALEKGDIVFLKAKRNKAEKCYAGYRHVIQPGESMYTIAQMYGIKLKALYRLNGKPTDYSAVPGDILWLR